MVILGVLGVLSECEAKQPNIVFFVADDLGKFLTVEFLDKFEIESVNSGSELECLDQYTSDSDSSRSSVQKKLQRLHSTLEYFKFQALSHIEIEHLEAIILILCGPLIAILHTAH